MLKVGIIAIRIVATVARGLDRLGRGRGGTNTTSHQAARAWGGAAPCS